MRRNYPILVLVIAFLSFPISCRGPGPTPTELPTATPMPTSTENSAPVLGDRQTRAADGMVMVYVPAGDFQMGSSDEEVDAALTQCQTYLQNCQRRWYEDEQPSRSVALDGFWIDQTEVTNEQYQACVETGACEEPACWDDDTFNAPGYPVVCVNWYQAQAYCAWVGGRLPTEAEWEYAARGPKRWTYPWGQDFDGARLNYCDASCSENRRDEAVNDGFDHTAPVGRYMLGISWCGALDMAGNVWEWVEDWYEPYPSEPQVNPTGASAGRLRVVRGGAWHASPLSARTAKRGWGGPSTFSTYAGFRCVVSESPAAMPVP